MKTLLIGSTGQLGTSLLPKLKDFEVSTPERRDLDLMNFESICRYIDKNKPELIINCAAFHNVPLCETEYVNAFMCNSFAVRELAKASAQFGSTLVTFSTDYVFDGSKQTGYVESDCPSPVQVYGSSKYQGEIFFRATSGSSGYIIRTSSLYGSRGSSSKGGNFVLNRLKDWKENGIKKIEISSELKMCPTYTDDLADATVQLVTQMKPRGVEVCHLACEGQASWASFTSEIYKKAGANVEVVPVDRKGKTGEMRRPLNSVLKNTVLKSRGIALPNWEESLERYIRYLKEGKLI